MKLIWGACLGWLMSGICTHAAVDVVATNAIIADWIKEVGGTEVRVTTLASAGSDPHHYSPGPAMARHIADADLVVSFGSGMEGWLGDFLDATRSPVPHLELSRGLPLMRVAEPYWEAMETLHPDAASKPLCCREDAQRENETWTLMIEMMPESEHHDSGGHHHEEYDPHVWLDPQLALRMVLAINRKLNEIAPDQAAYFDQRRVRYLESLLEFDRWAEQQLATVPVERRILINHHDNLRYLGRRYGFLASASILNSATTETADPSARQFGELVTFIQARRVPAVFVDATANPRLAEQLAREANLPPPVTLYTGNLTSATGDAPSYRAMMQANVTAITNALQ